MGQTARGYPRAGYRPGASGYGGPIQGFQGSNPNVSSPAPQRAANSNVFAMPVPANENTRSPSSWGVPRVPPGTGALLEGLGLKLAARSIPYLNYALLAWDIYQALKPAAVPAGPMLYPEGGWTLPFPGWDIGCGGGPGMGGTHWYGNGCGTWLNISKADLPNPYVENAYPGKRAWMCLPAQIQPDEGNPSQVWVQAATVMTKTWRDDLGEPAPEIPAPYKGYELAPEPYPEPGLNPWKETGPASSPRPRNDPRLAVNPGPSFSWSPKGQTSSPGVWRPRRPPRPGEKEKKYVMTLHSAGGAAVWTGRIFGMATEWSDFVDALYDALPDESKKWRALWLKDGKTGAPYMKVVEAKMSIAAKSAWVWNHIDEIDVNAAFYNLATNELQDTVQGRLGSATAKAFGAASGRPVSITWGPTL